jgi:hypothetical protein
MHVAMPPAILAFNGIGRLCRMSGDFLQYYHQQLMNETSRVIGSFSRMYELMLMYGELSNKVEQRVAHIRGW